MYIDVKMGDPPPRRHEPLHPGRRAGPRQLGPRAAGPGGEVQAGQGRAAGEAFLQNRARNEELTKFI